MRLISYCLSVVLALSALAAEPALPAPAFHTSRLGAYKLVSLLTDQGVWPIGAMIDMPRGKMLAALKAAKLGPDIDTSNNAFLIDTGSRRILIDAGDNVLASLKAAGYQPEQIDDILLTHLHSDHVVGLANKGARVFPNATVHVERHETDFWLEPANTTKLPAGFDVHFKDAKAALAPYQAAGRLALFDGDAAILPSVRAVSRFGHTPGHVNYLVESEGKRLVAIGDGVLVAALQFPYPETVFKVDPDKAGTARAQRAIYRDAAEHGDLVAGAHLAFPGLGYLHAAGEGFAWQAVKKGE
ncbi:MBL fold metallo-hydrolase [Chitinimonas sp.]|uniref:MBL fold metallo-hydrolase n=1 Tax=Chitinimonas sp. TaxID=1934313 RepID=UPI0035AF83F6